MIQKGTADLYQPKSVEPGDALLVKIDGMSRDEAMGYFLDDAKRDELVKASGGWDAPIFSAITGKVLGLEMSDPGAKLRLEDNARLSQQHPNRESPAYPAMLREYNREIDELISDKKSCSYLDLPNDDKNVIAARLMLLRRCCCCLILFKAA